MSEHKFPLRVFHKIDKHNDGQPKSVVVTDKMELGALVQDHWVFNLEDVPGYVAKTEKTPVSEEKLETVVVEKKKAKK